MKHVISEVVQMSMINSDGNINDFVPNLIKTDRPRIYPTLNHHDVHPFLPPDLQDCPNSWENNQYLEEHPSTFPSAGHAGCPCSPTAAMQKGKPDDATSET